jgi:hypothetical protein
MNNESARKIIFDYCSQIFTIFIALLLVACSKLPSEWQEEVKLSNDKVIIISRSTDYVSGGGEWASNPGLHAPDIRHIEFKFPFESSQKITWKSQPEKDGLYPEYPVVFDMENGYPVIISLGSRKRGCPEYRRYVFRNSTWHRQPLLADDWRRKSNLLIGSSNEYLITLEKKSLLDKSGSFTKWQKNIDPAVNECR